MRDLEGFAGQTVEKVTDERFARRERDRVHEAVETIPVLAQLLEQSRDLLVATHVTAEDDLAAELGRQFADAFLDAFTLEREGELSTFAMAGACDAVCDRAAAEHARDEYFPVLQKSHGVVPARFGPRYYMGASSAGLIRSAP